MSKEPTGSHFSFNKPINQIGVQAQRKVSEKEKTNQSIVQLVSYTRYLCGYLSAQLFKSAGRMLVNPLCYLSLHSILLTRNQSVIVQCSVPTISDFNKMNIAAGSSSSMNTLFIILT